MIEPNQPVFDEDLSPRFRWRWSEHGIYLVVCTVIALLVFGLFMLPRTPKKSAGPMIIEVIHVRYAFDEPAEKDDPFHDPRIIRPYRKASPPRRAM